MPDLSTVLQKADDILKVVGEAAGGSPVGTVAKIVSLAIETALIFAAGGKDPLAEIQRIHDADPLLQEMRAEWQQRIDTRFPEGG